MKSILFTLLFSSIINICIGQGHKELLIANDSLKEGNYSKAIELFTKLIISKKSTIKHEAYYGRAYSYYKNKNYKKANSDINKALKVKNDNVNYDWIKGNSYWLKSSILSNESNSIKSLYLLKRASKFIKSSQLYSTIGFEEIELNRNEEAIESLNYSILIDSTNAWAFSNRALAKLNLKQYDKAIIDIEESIELDNKNPFAYKHRALIFIALGNFESACSDLEHASSLTSTFRMSDYKMQEIKELFIQHCDKTR